MLGTFSISEKSTNRAAHSRGRHGSQSSNIQPINLENSKAPAMSPRISASKNGLGAVPDSLSSKDAMVAATTALSPAQVNTADAIPPAATDAVDLKTEPAEAGEEPSLLEAEQVVTVVTTRTGRVSKTATPIVANFAEASSTRNAGGRSRGRDIAGNGSHASSESGHAQSDRTSTRERRRRGEGREHSEARRQALAQELASENGDEADAEEVEGEDDEEEENEPRYCYCNEVSYGEMVACDNENCQRQWFHLRCAGLREAPTTAKWYCDDCKANMKESRKSRPVSRRE
jgi:hypothetical protein